MRFGLFTSMGMQTWSGVLELWQHLEKTGWDIACVTDHFFPNTKEREGAMLESWSTLSALAALVPRMRVGTIVLGNTYRHPAVVAKMAAQVDIISGGRLLLGLGAGWQQNEHEGYGIPFYTMKERLERLDEACQVMRSLWTERRSNFKGQYYQLSDAPLDPKPVQSPHPELMIGGGGERVTLRIVARHADHWNVWGGPQVVSRKGKILDEHCAAVGRDPKTITRSVNMALLITDKKAEIEAARQDHRDPDGPPRRRRPRHLPGRHPGSDPRAAAAAQGQRRQRPLHPEPVPSAAGAAPRPRSLHRGDRPRVPVVGQCRVNRPPAIRRWAARRSRGSGW